MVQGAWFMPILVQIHPVVWEKNGNKQTNRQADRQTDRHTFLFYMYRYQRKKSFFSLSHKKERNVLIVMGGFNDVYLYNVELIDFGEVSKTTITISPILVFLCRKNSLFLFKGCRLHRGQHQHPPRVYSEFRKTPFLFCNVRFSSFLSAAKPRPWNSRCCCCCCCCCCWGDYFGF